MKFIVSRTSIWDNDVSPCEDAKRDSIIRVQTRIFHTPEEFDAKFAKTEGRWLSIGTNHRVNKNGHITRDNGTIDVWMVEFNTLEDLVGFCNKYGDVVIDDCIWNDAYKHIEIYDDYRE